MGFGTGLGLHNHQHFPILKPFYHPKKKPCAHSQPGPSCPSPGSRLLCLHGLACQDIHINVVTWSRGLASTTWPTDFHRTRAVAWVRTPPLYTAKYYSTFVNPLTSWGTLGLLLFFGDYAAVSAHGQVFLWRPVFSYPGSTPRRGVTPPGFHGTGTYTQTRGV